MKVLLYQNEGHWTAQSLEVDLSAFGSEESFALSNWRAGKIFLEYLDWSHQLNALSKIPPAHERFFKDFEQAEIYTGNISDIHLSYESKTFQCLASELEVKKII